MGNNHIKRISGNEPTSKELHNLKCAGQICDELSSGNFCHDTFSKSMENKSQKIDENREFVDFKTQKLSEG